MKKKVINSLLKLESKENIIIIFLLEKDLRAKFILILCTLQFGNEDVIIAGAKHIPPNHMKLIDEMEQFITWYIKEGTKLHPIERAARLHVDFVKIHPFIDGNGRTARLLLNLELMKAGYPPIIIRNENRVEYYNALDFALTKGKYEEFYK